MQADGSIQDDRFAIHCPVKPLMEEQELLKVTSPYEALEGASIAAIMARVAALNLRERQQQDGNENDDNDSLGSYDYEELEEQTDGRNTESLSATHTSNDEPKSHGQQQQQQQRRATLELSTAFKAGTTVAHQAAEDVHFVRNFIQGKIDRNLYSDLVVSLFHVYKALEEELDQHAPTSFGSCHFPNELNRTETLREDLDFWRGPRDGTDMSPATRDYVDRIHQVAATEPLLLLSHAYTRYLGDLSGGKVLKRVAKRAMGLDGDGLAFYDFANIQSAKLFKDRYRECLDGLELTPAQVSALVSEANVAFILNMRVFEELDVKANVPNARVRDLSDAFAIASKAREEQNKTNSNGDEAEKQECPFLQNKKQSSPSNDKQQHSQSIVSTTDDKRCPWPFIFAHDPATGMRDVQTWIVLGLLLMWIWSRFAAMDDASHQ